MKYFHTFTTLILVSVCTVLLFFVINSTTEESAKASPSTSLIDCFAEISNLSFDHSYNSSTDSFVIDYNSGEIYKGAYPLPTDSICLQTYFSVLRSIPRISNRRSLSGNAMGARVRPYLNRYHQCNPTYINTQNCVNPRIPTSSENTNIFVCATESNITTHHCRFRYEVQANNNSPIGGTALVRIFGDNHWFWEGGGGTQVRCKCSFHIPGCHNLWGLFC